MGRLKQSRLREPGYIADLDREYELRTVKASSRTICDECGGQLTEVEPMGNLKRMYRCNDCTGCVGEL